MPLAEDQQLHDLSDTVELPRMYGPPRLFVIARDPYTIFTYWNIDWPSIFKDGEPVDRQVHLRVCCADGLEEKSVGVEPMAGIHYVTMSRRHRSCRIEIGYYRPADVWRSVATSNEIMMPSDEISRAEQADVATVPFHIAFERLFDLFGAANGEALAVVMSRFQTQVLSGQENRELTFKEKKILRQGGIAFSEIASARRAFDEIDSKKLAKRTEALRGLGPISSSQAFKKEWTLVAS